MASRDDRDGFEQFYKSVRQDLLLQTYALTGDLSAAEKAVRDALVVAWHHWRKVSRLEDPGAWVRPLAWSRAQRRHTARWWHRQRDIPASTRATLDALGSLTPTQRKALLLTVLTPQPLDAIAAEVGLSQAALERELQLANAQFSLARNVTTTSVRPLVEALRAETAGARWPRATILLRAGTTRRRSHTTMGVAAAVVATVVSGSLVTDAGGVRPDLASKGITATAPPAEARPATPEPPLANAVLLGPEQLGTSLGGTWTTGTTTRNAEGDGLNITCQQARYADPLGVGSLVRTFTAAPTGRRQSARPARSVRTTVQAVERSADATVAGATYELTRSWYGACTEPRLQLMATYDVAGVADAATLVALRSWADPDRMLLVGVARTGTVTTTVATTTPGADRADQADIAAGSALLGAAVTALCSAPGGGTCPTTPAAREIRPLPVEEAPAMIGEMDLPPVSGVSAPWAGTTPAPATSNDASTRCDKADFSGGGMSNASTRSFLVPEATDLPPQFGLTETVGSLPSRRATAFVAGIRERLDTCAERDLGTQVEPIDEIESKRRSLRSWNLRVEIDDDRFVDYKMAIMRSGTAVAQLGFIAAEDADMTDEQFRTLCRRAMQRLDALPAPA